MPEILVGLAELEVILRDFEYTRWQKQLPLLRNQKKSMHAVDYLMLAKLAPFLFARVFSLRNLKLTLRPSISKLDDPQKWLQEILAMWTVESERQTVVRRKVHKI